MQRNGHPILVQILLAELCKKRHSHASPYMRIVQSPQCNIHFFFFFGRKRNILLISDAGVSGKIV